MYANYIPGLYKSLPFIPLTMGAWEEQEAVDRRKKGHDAFRPIGSDGIITFVSFYLAS